MKAAWDWSLPTETDDEQKAVVEFAADLGFDTLVIQKATETLVRRGQELDVRIVQVVGPYATREFAEAHPHALQHIRDYEQQLAKALHGKSWNDVIGKSFRWVPLLQGRQMLCYEHEASREELKARLTRVLQVADGVAFDGFGFNNHYACFCELCERKRADMAAGNTHQSDLEIMEKMGERTLVDISRFLHEYVKSVKPDAATMNHVWPPYRPNEYAACKLKLDYCTQTISWFYRPVWSLQRVEFEAAEMKRLTDPDDNHFTPFIGYSTEPGLARSPKRVGRELDIALKYGEGSLVFCTLQGPRQNPELADVLRSRLKHAPGFSLEASTE